MEQFRLGVVAIIMNSDGKVLLCERSDMPSQWQFPQGGIEKGESATQAVKREVQEELGVEKIKIRQQSQSTYRYRWPEKANKKKGRAGQEMRFFLCEFAPGETPHLGESDGCFRATRWVTLEEAIAAIVDFKSECFRLGLQDLGLLAVPAPTASP